jgi:hypothetical protein
MDSKKRLNANLNSKIKIISILALPQGSGFQCQSFFGEKPKKGFLLQSLTQFELRFTILEKT